MCFAKHHRLMQTIYKKKCNQPFLNSTKASTFVPWPFAFFSWEEEMRMAWELCVMMVRRKECVIILANIVNHVAFLMNKIETKTTTA